VSCTSLRSRVFESTECATKLPRSEVLQCRVERSGQDGRRRRPLRRQFAPLGKGAAATAENLDIVDQLEFRFDSLGFQNPRHQEFDDLPRFDKRVFQRNFADSQKTLQVLANVTDGLSQAGDFLFDVEELYHRNPPKVKVNES